MRFPKRIEEPIPFEVPKILVKWSYFPKALDHVQACVEIYYDIAIQHWPLAKLALSRPGFGDSRSASGTITRRGSSTKTHHWDGRCRKLRCPSNNVKITGTYWYNTTRCSNYTHCQTMPCQWIPQHYASLLQALQLTIHHSNIRYSTVLSLCTLVIIESQGTSQCNPGDQLGGSWVDN